MFCKLAIKMSYNRFYKTSAFIGIIFIFQIHVLRHTLYMLCLKCKLFQGCGSFKLIVMPLMKIKESFLTFRWGVSEFGITWLDCWIRLRRERFSTCARPYWPLCWTAKKKRWVFHIKNLCKLMITCFVVVFFLIW